MVFATGRGSSTGVRVSAVIPTLNEAENLPHVFARIPQWVDEVVVVDGQSSDGTLDVARSLWPNEHVLNGKGRPGASATQSSEQEPVLRLVMQEGRGKGAALRTGFAAATGDVIVMLDADGSTDPGEIPSYVGALLSGADFAKGSRFLQGGGTADMSWYRYLGNWGFVQIVRVLFGGQYTDLCYGYNAFWKNVVPLLRLDGDGFEIETMMNVRALQAGLKIAEVPSFEAERIHGVSRLRTIPDGWRVLKTIMRERFSPTVRKSSEEERTRLRERRPRMTAAELARRQVTDAPVVRLNDAVNQSAALAETQ